jgi:hypothetical protein
MPQIDPNTGLVTYKGFPKGVDNRSSDFGVTDEFLRDAVNVDILNSGNVRRRRGISQKIASSGAHSVFSDDTRMVWATANKLYVAGADLAPMLLLTDPNLGLQPLSYAAVNGDIYFSNEYTNGKIMASGAAFEPWGIIPPQWGPVCTGSTVAAGAKARQYQVTCTFVTASGEESGAPLGTTVLCGDTPRIACSFIPQSLDVRVVATRLYVTNVDDTIFSHAMDVQKGTTSAVLNGYFANGAALKTQFNSNPPFGQLLEYHNGSIYIAQGNILWWTEPLRYSIYDNTANFLMFPERITMVKGVGDQGPREHQGLFISADQTYFIPFVGTGEVKAWPKLPYKAIEGAAMRLPNRPDVMWFSDRGFVRGKAGGEAGNLTEGQIAVDKYAHGALGYTEINGHKSAMAIMQTAIIPSFANPDVAVAEATRITEIV